MDEDDPRGRGRDTLGTLEGNQPGLSEGMKEWMILVVVRIHSPRI